MGELSHYFLIYVTIYGVDRQPPTHERLVLRLQRSMATSLTVAVNQASHLIKQKQVTDPRPKYRVPKYRVSKYSDPTPETKRPTSGMFLLSLLDPRPVE